MVVNFDGYNVKFSVNCRTSSDCEFIMNCRNCQNCFGCIGLDNKKFCILNKQYKEDEYFVIVDEIKSKMLKEGKYGEMLSIGLSPFPYNATLAQIVFPRTCRQVEKLGGYWYDAKSKITKNMEVVSILDVPTDIKDVKDDILNKAILGEGERRPYRIIKPELDFYRRKDLPIPSLHPYDRMIARFDWVNNFKIIEDICQKCGKEIYTSNESKKGFKPYCEECYIKEIV